MIIHSRDSLRLDFITKLIFIHLTIKTYDIPGRPHNPTNYIMDNV